VQHMNSKVFSMRGKKETASLTLAVLSPAWMSLVHTFHHSSCLVKSFIKSLPFPCKRHIFRDHKFACHGLDKSQDKYTDGDGNEISRSKISNVSFQNGDGRKVQQTSDPY
jgi:hypothetical protein